jgi:hypothetical protein
MFTDADVLETAEIVVARMPPGFRYSDDNGGACAYVPSTDPRFPLSPLTTVAPGANKTGCLIGEILKELGLLTDDIARYGGVFHNVLEDSDDLRAELSPRAQELMTFMQVRQDNGQTWREVLDAAYTEVGV